MDTAEPLTDPAGAFGDMLYDDWQALEGDMWWPDRESLGVVGAAGGVCGVSADPFGKWPTDTALHPADHSLAYTDGLDALIGPGTAGSLTLERGAWALSIAAPSPDDVETEWPLATAAAMGAEPVDGTVAVDDPQGFAPYDPSSILDPMSVPESSDWSVTNPTHCTDDGEAPDSSEPFGPIALAAANQWVASSSSSVPHTSPHFPDAQSNPIPKAISDPSPSSLDGPDALVVSEAAAVPMPSPPPDGIAAPSDGDPGWTGWPLSTPPTQFLAQPSDALLQCSDAIPADAPSSIPAALTYDSLIPSEASPDGPAVEPKAVPSAPVASPDGDPVPEGLPSTPADGHTDLRAEEEGNNSDIFYTDVTGVSAHANAAVASEPSPLDTGDEGDGEAPPSVSRLDPMTGLPLLDLAVPPPYDSGSSDPSLWPTHDPAESSAFPPTTGWMDAPGSAAPGWAPQGAACGWPGDPSSGTPWDGWSGWQPPSWGPPVYHQPPPPKPPPPLNETELKKRVGAELQWSFARVEELLAAKLITPEERNRRREALTTQQTAKHRAGHEAAVAKYLRATAAAAAAAAAAESYNWGPQFSSWDWAAPSSLNGPPRTGYSAPAIGLSQGGNVNPAVRPDAICLGYSKPPAKVESPPKPPEVKPTPPTPPPSAPSRRQQEGSGNEKQVQRQRPSTESAGGPLPLQDSSSTEPAPPAKRARSEASSEAWSGWGTWEGGCWGAGGGRGWSDTQDKVLCAAHQKMRSPASVVAKGDGWVCTEEFRCRAGTVDGDVGELQLCTTHNRTRASIHLSHGSDGLWRCRPGKECRDGAGVGWGDWGGASDEPPPGADAVHDIHT